MALIWSKLGFVMRSERGEEAKRLSEPRRDFFVSRREDEARSKAYGEEPTRSKSP